MNLKSAVEAIRHATDVAGTCPAGHGGHQYDARYCRVCGSYLITTTRGATVMAKKANTDASWTDDDDQKVRAALQGLGLATGGNRKTILVRLIEADKPEGWKWEG